MIHPKIDADSQEEYNRFALCIIIGKRARQLITGSPAMAECSSKNAVSIAINELSENKFLIDSSKYRSKKLVRPLERQSCGMVDRTADR